MKLTFACLVLSVLVCLPIAINGDVCSVNGRNCSHNCITTNGTSRCGCPCGKPLTNDNTTCGNFSIQCCLDIFFGIDLGSHVDPGACNQTVLPASKYLKWLKHVIGLLQAFQVMENLPNVNIGALTYSGPPPLTKPPLIRYDSTPNITDGINTLRGYTSPNCTGNSDFIQHAQFAGDDTGQIPSFVYNGPGPLKNRNKTTRIAIGVVYQYNEYGPNEHQLLIMRQRVLLSFDAIIIVTKTHSNSTLDKINAERARLVACGQKTSPCPRVFWMDRKNDEGVPISRQAIMATVNRQACIQTNSLLLASCDGAMAFRLSLCALQGLRWDELQFRDPSCSLRSNVTKLGPWYMYNMPFLSCGMYQSYVVVNGVVKQRFVQTITTRNTTTCPTVNLTITCTIAAFNKYSTLSLSQRSMIRGSQEENSRFDVTLKAYSNNWFTHLAPSLMFVIDCVVYVEAKATVPMGLSTVLYSCWATPSANKDDAVKYCLIKHGCARDPLTVLMPSPSNHINRFSFRMFEFASGYRLPKNKKPPVYIHCKLYVCKPTDNSSFCKPICNSPDRKRRAVGDEVPPQSVIATIGPFKVEHKIAESINVVNQPAVEEPQEVSNQLNSKISPYRVISIVSPWRVEWSNTALLSLISVLLTTFMIVYFGLLICQQRQKVKSYAMIKPPAYQDLQPLLQSDAQQPSSTELQKEH